MSRRIHQAILPGALACYAFVLGAQKVFESDIFWHIALGRDILGGGALPRSASLAYTGQDVPWIASEWLSEVLMSVVYSLGGFSALSALTGATLAASAALLYGALAGKGRHPVVPLLLLPLWVFLERGWLGGRPHMFSILFLCAFVRILRDPLTRSRVALLGAISALWANMHGGFLMGTALLACHAVEHTAMPRARRDITRLAWMGAAVSLAGTLLTPYHVRLIPFILSHSWTARNLDITVEFRPLTPFLPYLAGLAVFLVLGYFLPRRAPGLAAAAVFGAMALYSQRIVPFFLVAAVPAMSGIMQAGVDQCPTRIRKRLAAIPALGFILSGALAAALLVSGLGKKEFPFPGFGVQMFYYPRNAMSFIKTVGLTGRMYNSMNFAGPLLFEGYPETRVFQGTFYSEREIHLREGLSFPDTVKKYAITHALLEKRLALLNSGLFPRTQWAIIYWDDISIVLARRIPQNAAIIAKHEYMAVSPEDLLESVENNLIPPAAQRELERAVAEAPASALARLALGVAYSARSDTGAALREFEAAAALPASWTYQKGGISRLPYQELAWLHMGILHAGRGDLPRAEEAFRQAARVNPASAQAYYNLGILLSDMGKLDDAEASLRKSLRIHSGDSRTWNNLGVVLWKKGDSGGAAAAFRKALGINPLNGEARNNLDRVERRRP